MTRLSPKDLERQELEKNYALLMEQYTAVTAKVRTTQDPDTAVTLKQAAADLLQKIEVTDTLLQKLEEAVTLPAGLATVSLLSAAAVEERRRQSQERQQRFQRTFPKIDFKAVEHVRKILTCSERNWAAALLFIEEYRPLAGHWGLHHLRNLLNDDTLDFKEVTIQIPESAGLSEITLLEHFEAWFADDRTPSTGHLGIPAGEEPTVWAQRLVKRLAGSLQTGSVVFLVVRPWDEVLRSAGHLLPWFLEHLWKPLLKEVEQVAQNYSNIRVVAVVALNGELKSALPEGLCCSQAVSEHEQDWQRTFDRNLLLKLPLRNWTSDEVTQWLRAYSGQDLGTVDRWSNDIYSASARGLPILIAQAIEAKLLSSLL